MQLTSLFRRPRPTLRLRAVVVMLGWTPRDVMMFCVLFDRRAQRKPVEGLRVSRFYRDMGVRIPISASPQCLQKPRRRGRMPVAACSLKSTHQLLSAEGFSARTSTSPVTCNQWAGCGSIFPARWRLRDFLSSTGVRRGAPPSGRNRRGWDTSLAFSESEPDSGRNRR